MKDKVKEMKKRKASIATLFTVAALAGIGFGNFITVEQAGAKSKDLIDVASNKRPEKVNQNIVKSWRVATATYDIDTQEWTQYDYTDRYKFLDTLSQQEKNSFSDAFVEAMANNSKEGDSMPLVLVNDKKDRVVFLFQRDFGTGKSVKIELVAKQVKQQNQISKNSEGVYSEKEWDVGSIEEK
ncbi:hypothetical protein ABEV02_22125 [Brevibacillus agri]|uniref:hypothetical protein n=2 Tax=Brevibacillus agri TaxID=51101 RepID=UPI003D1D2520